MATKLIENLDSEIWRKFVGYTKMCGRKVGPMLSDVLEEFLKDATNNYKKDKEINS